MWGHGEGSATARPWLGWSFLKTHVVWESYMSPPSFCVSTCWLLVRALVNTEIPLSDVARIVSSSRQRIPRWMVVSHCRKLDWCLKTAPRHESMRPTGSQVRIRLSFSHFESAWNAAVRRTVSNYHSEWDQVHDCGDESERLFTDPAQVAQETGWKPQFLAIHAARRSRVRPSKQC